MKILNRKIFSVIACTCIYSANAGAGATLSDMEVNASGLLGGLIFILPFVLFASIYMISALEKEQEERKRKEQEPLISLKNKLKIAKINRKGYDEAVEIENRTETPNFAQSRKITTKS